MPSALSTLEIASSALPAQAGIAECGQLVEQGDGLAEVLARAVVVLGVVGLGVVGLGAVEQRGQGGLDGIERVLQKPVAALAAGGAAGALGPDQATASARLERQVDAGAQLHVSASQKTPVSSGDLYHFVAFEP